MGETGMKPIRLETVYKKTVWAGERLSKIRGLTEPGIGIAREICAYKGSENKVASGEYVGMDIGTLIREHGKELMGEDTSGQLVRVAYIDAEEDLSIQVHPNEEQAAPIGDYEKSEAWYILEADEGAYITAGVNTQDKEVLRKAAESGGLEQYLIRHPVKKGDVALIPAGMVHACGGHTLSLEVGSFGGITYRLYDYGRPRPLDLDDSFRIMDPSLQCEVKHFAGRKAGRIQNAIRHSMFSADIIDVEDNFVIAPEERYYVLTCVEGECTVVAQGQEETLAYTQTILVPAACGEVIIKGDARLLKSYRS